MAMQELKSRRAWEWMGVAHYEEKDADFFIGREVELRTLERRVVDNPNGATVVFGSSGVGKSSLLEAGLCASLRRRNYVPIVVRFDEFIGNGSEEEGNSLLAFVRRAIEVSTESYDKTTLVAIEKDSSLWDWIRLQRFTRNSRPDPRTRILLILDQIDSIIGAPAMTSPRKTFVSSLCDLADNRVQYNQFNQLLQTMANAGHSQSDLTEFHLIASIREDNLAAFLAIASESQELNKSSNFFRLEPMDGVKALTILEESGQFQPRLQVRLVHAAGFGEVASQEIDSAIAPGTDRVPTEVRNSLVNMEVEPMILSMLCKQVTHEHVHDSFPLSESNVTLNDSHVFLEFYKQCISTAGIGVEGQRYIREGMVSRSNKRVPVYLVDARANGLSDNNISALLACLLFKKFQLPNADGFVLIHDRVSEAIGELRAELEQNEEIESRKQEADKYEMLARTSKGAMKLFATACLPIVVLALYATLQWNKARDEAAALQNKIEEVGELNTLKEENELQIRELRKLQLVEAEAIAVRSLETADKSWLTRAIEMLNNAESSTSETEKLPNGNRLESLRELINLGSLLVPLSVKGYIDRLPLESINRNQSGQYLYANDGMELYSTSSEKAAPYIVNDAFGVPARQLSIKPLPEKVRQQLVSRSDASLIVSSAQDSDGQRVFSALCGTNLFIWKKDDVPTSMTFSGEFKSVTSVVPVPNWKVIVAAVVDSANTPLVIVTSYDRPDGEIISLTRVSRVFERQPSSKKFLALAAHYNAETDRLTICAGVESSKEKEVFVKENYLLHLCDVRKSNSGTMKFEIISDEKGYTFEGHEQRVMSLDISPDGELVASGSTDGHVRIWTRPKGGRWIHDSYVDIDADTFAEGSGATIQNARWIRSLKFISNDTLLVGKESGLLATWTIPRDGNWEYFVSNPNVPTIAWGAIEAKVIGKFRTPLYHLDWVSKGTFGGGDILVGTKSSMGYGAYRISREPAEEKPIVTGLNAKRILAVATSPVSSKPEGVRLVAGTDNHSIEVLDMEKQSGGEWNFSKTPPFSAVPLSEERNAERLAFLTSKLLLVLDSKCDLRLYVNEPTGLHYTDAFVNVGEPKHLAPSTLLISYATASAMPPEEITVVTNGGGSALGESALLAFEVKGSAREWTIARSKSVETELMQLARIEGEDSKDSAFISALAVSQGSIPILALGSRLGDVRLIGLADSKQSIELIEPIRLAGEIAAMSFTQSYSDGQYKDALIVSDTGGNVYIFAPTGENGKWKECLFSASRSPLQTLVAISGGRFLGNSMDSQIVSGQYNDWEAGKSVVGSFAHDFPGMKNLFSIDGGSAMGFTVRERIFLVNRSSI